MMFLYPDMHLHIAESAVLNLHNQIDQVFLNSTSSKDFNDVESATTDERVFPFYGIHPWFADGESGPGGRQAEALREKLEKDSLCGIGECGLDGGSRYRENLDTQRAAFEYQLKLACDYRRPVSVHCVRAWGLLIEILSGFTPLPRPFILHSFYGSAEVLQRLLDFGAYISLSSLSLRNPERSSPVIRQIPLNRLLVESDLQAGSQNYTGEGHFDALRINYRIIADIMSLSEKELLSGVIDNGKVFTN